MAADDPRDGVPGAAYLTTEELRRDVSALREILQARLDGMDTATVVLSETVNRTPTAIETAISHLKELHSERFTSIALQFKERDERGTQLATTQAEALQAALLSAEKLNAALKEANEKANTKTEITFGQQIKAVEDKIEVINRRLDTGQGAQEGSSVQRTERRLDSGLNLSAVAVLISGILVAIALYAALHK